MTQPVMTFTCSLCGTTASSPITGEFSCGERPPFRALVPGHSFDTEYPSPGEWVYFRSVYRVGIDQADNDYSDNNGVGDQANLILCPTCVKRVDALFGDSE